MKTNRLKEKLIRELAKEMGLPMQTVKQIADSQFALVAQTMKEGTFGGVRLPALGKFTVHPYRVQKLNEQCGSSPSKAVSSR